jgi:hypothetical protein
MHISIIRIGILIFTTGFLLTSCGLNKEVVKRLNESPIEYADFPIDYCNLFPDSTNFKKWDEDYNFYEKYLTNDILKTQVGLSYFRNDVNIWWCFPSARTHVQLDTATMISDKNLIVGGWRMISNRRITYKDSVCLEENKIYRTSKLDFNNKEDDLFLLITADKFKLYAKCAGKEKYKRYGNRNYDIENKRYLMLYGASKAGAAISFIGLDKEGRLIVNSYFVEERIRKGVYAVYQATMTQLIYKKMDIN